MLNVPLCLLQDSVVEALNKVKEADEAEERLNTLRQEIEAAEKRLQDLREAAEAAEKNLKDLLAKIAALETATKAKKTAIDEQQ